ncbi:hypothetical protein EJ110_NYTH23701 [Nymphaea thermarum]|nr:hypothetical protein EJ110_NYTH23701 [Nymphaea thermarum]
MGDDGRVMQAAATTELGSDSEGSSGVRRRPSTVTHGNSTIGGRQQSSMGSTGQQQDRVTLTVIFALCPLFCRLLPYHVVADYEAEEDDKLLDADPTGQMMSRLQQWDHNIAVKIAEFTATFEKQVLAFNILTRKRAQGEIRLEERLMIEQALLQDEKQAYMEVRAEIESREKAGREAAEAKLRMAMAQAEQARAEAQARAEMMARGGATSSDPVRLGSSSQGNAEENTNEMPGQEQGVNMEEILHGWGNVQREEEEPPEDFLNDDHEQNSENGLQEDWHEVGELDLNTR